MEEKDIKKNIKEETEKIINNILKEGIKSENVDMLGKIVDIHKDIANERYWEKKEEHMRYNTGRSYGREQYGREYGNYGNYGNYGRRGVDAKYRGEEMMDEIYQNYQNYSESREEYGRGNYGAKDDSIKSLDYMMKSVVNFVKMLEQDANSQEEVELIKNYTRQISDM